MTTLHTPTTAAALIINARTGKPGVTRARVVTFCRQGRLRAERAGRGWIITSEEMERFNELERKRGVKK